MYSLQQIRQEVGLLKKQIFFEQPRVDKVQSWNGKEAWEEKENELRKTRNKNETKKKKSFPFFLSFHTALQLHPRGGLDIKQSAEIIFNKFTLYHFKLGNLIAILSLLCMRNEEDMNEPGQAL